MFLNCPNGVEKNMFSEVLWNFASYFLNEVTGIFYEKFSPMVVPDIYPRTNAVLLKIKLISNYHSYEINLICRR